MASEMRFLNCHCTDFATNVGPSNFVPGLIEDVFLDCLAILLDLGSGTDTSRCYYTWSTGDRLACIVFWHSHDGITDKFCFCWYFLFFRSAV